MTAYVAGFVSRATSFYPDCRAARQQARRSAALLDDTPVGQAKARPTPSFSWTDGCRCVNGLSSGAACCSFRISLGKSLIHCSRGRDGPEHVRELLHFALPLLLVGEDRLSFCTEAR
jgi:hypothetical protein